MAKTLFHFNHYLEFIRYQIDACHSVRGYQSRLAEAAGCQRSYFSQILKERIEMTAEQAIGLASFWHLAPLEVEYFLTLVHLARAGVPKLKKYYEQQAERIRRAGHSVTQRMAGEQIGANEACEYYSNWHWMAIHTLLAVPGHTTAPKIARRLGISESIVARSLTTMQGWGLVIREAKGWNILKDNLHLPNTSPMTRVNHANWRRRAELDMERENENSLHYTAVFALSARDASEIREELLSMLSRLRQKIQASPSEEIYAMTLDFLQV